MWTGLAWQGCQESRFHWVDHICFDGVRGEALGSGCPERLGTVSAQLRAVSVALQQKGRLETQPICRADRTTIIGSGSSSVGGEHIAELVLLLFRLTHSSESIFDVQFVGE